MSCPFPSIPSFPWNKKTTSFEKSENSTNNQPSLEFGGSGETAAPKPRKGFTLIELLIVLVLIGLSISIVIPNVGTALDKIKFRGNAKKIIELVRKIRFQAFYYQKNIVLTEKDGRLVITGIMLDEEIPDVLCRVKEEIRFASNGVSDGGEILLFFKDRAAARIVVADFTGQPKLEFS
jgi:prepilin-type N-terminal cleavage/methylation domain-containing protein